MRLVAILSATFLAAAPAAHAQGLLPDSVRPERYDLTLVPDAARLTFTGEVAVTLRAESPQSSLVLDAVGLRIRRATLDGAPVRVAMSARAQTVRFTPAAPIAPGRHVLRVGYTGRILQRAAGLFAVDAVGADGRPQRTLVTQFEPADARRLAPLFDEPAEKAAFALTVVAPADRMVVSNMPVASSTPLEGGLRRVRFATTPPMASYLLFVGVGDFERRSRRVDGVDLGVVVARGQLPRAEAALDTAAAVLRDYDAWFGVRYPLPKLDLVIAPGEVGAAMENWGAMLFGASSVLIDPQISTEADRRAAALLVAHEMAHQWFGDLVTMKWWNDLWLNEAFASWRSTKALEELHPEWRPWIAAMSDTEEALTDDTLATSHPIERTIRTTAQAAQAFDTTTYEKGQAVVRMIERYVGPDAFRDGVRRYMRRYAYRNTVGGDLWREISAASRRDVSAVADDFTRQPGAPLVSVEASATEPTSVTLRQSRLTEVDHDAPGRWRTPLALEGLAKTEILLDAPQDIARAGAPPVIVNAGAVAYARIAYSADAFQALLAGYAGLDPVDQIAILDDAWALGLAGRRPLADSFALIDRLPLDADPAVWRRVITVLALADDLHDDGPARTTLQAWARRRLQPLHARLGWAPVAGESPDVAGLRGATLISLARFGDPEVLAEARRRFDVGDADQPTTSAETRRTILRIVSRHADAAAYAALLAKARQAHEPMKREMLYGLLGRATDPALGRRTLDLSLSDEIPSDLAPSIVLTVAEQHPGLAWRFAIAHRAALLAQLDSVGGFDFLPDIAADSYDPERADALLADARVHLAAPDRESAEHAAALIRFNARVRSDRLPAFDAWIAAHG